MNKKQVFLLIGITLILIGLIASLVFVFIGLYGSTSASPDQEGDMEQYIIDNWTFQDCLWDSESNTLTAIRTFDLSYEEAQEIGGRVFSGDLAPEGYLAQAITIEADLRSRFPIESLTVILSFRGRDEEELFRVDSNGQISTCWDNAE